MAKAGFRVGSLQIMYQLYRLVWNRKEIRCFFILLLFLTYRPQVALCMIPWIYQVPSHWICWTGFINFVKKTRGSTYPNQASEKSKDFSRWDQNLAETRLTSWYLMLEAILKKVIEMINCHPTTISYHNRRYNPGGNEWLVMIFSLYRESKVYRVE